MRKLSQTPARVPLRHAAGTAALHRTSIEQFAAQFRLIGLD
jgi:hypothetical protein